MGKVAWVFPGQGSQALGMGRDVAEAMPETKWYLDMASSILGYDLAALCFEGPEAQLRETQFTQPALLTVSTMLAHVLASHGLRPDAVAGHSLGEYSALVAAGSLSFAEGVQLVGQRGKLMEEAVPKGEGSMAVLLGMETEEIEKICQEAAEGDVLELANINSPDQIVISGATSAVHRAMAIGQERGARRVIELAVSGPFHSSLMYPAAERFTSFLEMVDWKEPQIPMVANVTANYVTDAGDIPGLLTDQLHRPVRWEETIDRLISDGVETFVEIGPGKVLTGLVKRISRKSKVVNFQGMQGLEKVLEMTKGDIVI
ncbi:MAG: ACP S-malonyltransferase [Firmicutes bacterium]|nr:ACP S-malonyltransferase [Bacillota bacterium]